MSALRRRLGQGARIEALRKVSDRVDLLFQFLARYRHFAKEASPEALLRRWQEDFGRGDKLETERLVRLAESAGSVLGLDTVLTGKEADLERRGGAPRQEAVSLMTLHAAKGLEFPVVFICGVEEGLIPSGAGDVDVDEERRLFYVGLTRAKDEVLLTRARSRRLYCRRIKPEVSRFVREVPDDLMEEERVRPGSGSEAVRQLSLWGRA